MNRSRSSRCQADSLNQTLHPIHRPSLLKPPSHPTPTSTAMQPKHVYLLLLVPSFLSTSSFILPPVHHTKPLAASRLNTASPPPEPTPSLEPTSSPELTPVYAGRPSLFKKGSNPFTSACRTYLSYLSRLLTETSLPARSRLSHMKLLKSIDTLESALEGELTEANDEEVRERVCLVNCSRRATSASRRATSGSRRAILPLAARSLARRSFARTHSRFVRRW